MEPRFSSELSKSPPFCSGNGKTMSLAEPEITAIQSENGTEFTLITTPIQVADGEVIHHVVQHVGADQQENIDPQTQVLMLPFTVSSDQFGQDGTQYEQVHVLQEQFQGQVGVPFGVDGGHYQQVVVTGGPDGQQHQILISHHPEVPPLQQQQQQQQPQPQQQPQQPQQQQQQQVVQTEPGVMAPPPPAPPQPPEIKPPVGKGPFRCEICDKMFPKWNQLQRHLRSHEDDKPHRCPHCPNTFNVEDNLKLHIATHSDEPVCPECGKKFSRIASLKSHIMLHQKEENLMCAECGDEFSLQSQLDKHLVEHREEQEGTRMYPCRQCSMEFAKHSQFREHMKQHNKVRTSLSHRTYKRNIDRTGFCHKCTHCSKTFQKPSQLQRHVRIHTGERPYKCYICEKAFNQNGALHIHMTKHTGQKPHVCEFCPMTFSQKGNLRAHIQRVHSTPKDSETPVFKCDECSCVFRKLGSLNAHMSRMHSDSIVNEVLLEPPSQVTVQLEDPGVVKKEDGQEDNGDGEGQSNQSQLQTIQLQQHTADGKVTGVNQVVIQQLVQLSERVTDSENGQQQIQQINSDLLQQALENSGLTVVPQGSSTGQTEGTIVRTTASTSATTGSVTAATSSNITNKDIGVLGTLTIHDAATNTVKKHVVRKINGVRWHQCTYCAKEFKKPSDLVRHIRIHTHEKPYKCSQCFRAFAVKSTLTAHVKTHTGIKEFKCPMCEKMFSTTGSLRVHVRLHTGDKPFGCPHCDKKFRTSGHRKSHIASHFKESSPRKPRRVSKRTSKPEIPMPDIALQEPILITDTGLIQQAPRNSQLYTHFFGEGGSVDRPYKCGYCSRGFKKSSHLKQHVRSHTGEKPYKCPQCMRAFVSSGVLKAHVRTHTGEKCYKCLICDATFTTNGSLKRHMSTHSEVRPFMCPYCQKTFKTSVNCKKHMKTHKQELAIQALQAQSGEKEPELVVEHEVPEPGGEEEHDAVTPGPEPAYTQPDVQQVDLAATLQQQALTQEQQALQELTQQEFNQQTGLGQAELTQQNVIQDALVTDAQFQSTLNQQVFGGQQFGQQTNFSQSLLHNNSSQQTFNQLNFSQPQFNLQSQQVSTSLDIGSLATLSQTTGSITTNLTSTSMQNILQTREPDLTIAQRQRQEVIQQEVEDGKRSYRCGFCDKAFKKSSHLKQHIRSHTGEKPYRCSQCGRMFVSTGVLKAHMRTHSGNKDYKCHVCHGSFTTNGSLTRHMMIHSSVQPFKCPYCDETFRTAFHCKRHMRAHREGGDLHSENGDAEKPPKRSRSTIIQITEEQAEKLSRQQPNENMTVSEKLLIESAAEKDRVSEVKERHVTIVDGEDVEDGGNDSGQDVSDIKIIAIAGGRQCGYCSKTFKKPSDLVRHTRIHTGEKPYDCMICGRSFTVKSTLDSHQKTHAACEKRFRCHVCNSVFSTKGSLKVHMRLHTGAKPFKCPHCDQRFRTSGHRKSHIQSHFKPAAPKKRRYMTRASQKQQEPQQVDMINIDAQAIQNAGVTTTTTNQLQVGNQVINIDQSLLQGQNLMPVSLSLDSLGITESGLAAQVLQGLDGVELQLAGGVGQNIQITGLDPRILTQTIQLDASVLAQLQQQGNLNLSINPNVISGGLQTADPNLVQNMQIQVQQPQQQLSQPSQDPLNPNIVIQPYNIQTVVQEPTNGVISGQTSVGELQLQQVTLNPSVVVSSAGAIPEQQVQHIQVEVSDLAQFQQVAAQQQQQAHHQIQVRELGVVSEVSDGSPLIVAADLSEEDDTTAPEGVSENTILLEESSDLNMNTALNTALDRSHVCQVCGKAFRRQGHLKEHMMTHDPCRHNKAKVRYTPHVCPTCDKGFSKPSQLQRHVRIHTGERPFVCDICKRAFNQKNTLQIHMKKHNGERPHKCPYCDLAFTQKGNLKTHIRRAHHVDMVQSMNIVPKPSTTGPEVVLSESVDGTVRPTPPPEEGIDLEGVVTDLFSH